MERVRGEQLGATAPWQNRSQTKKNKPALNTKLRILPNPASLARGRLEDACDVWRIRCNLFAIRLLQQSRKTKEHDYPRTQYQGE